MKIQSLNVGDQVAWHSQAGGNWKTKIGPVVEIVHGGHLMPDRAQLETRHGGSTMALRGAANRRNYTRYVVKCDGRLYCPVSSILQKQPSAANTTS